MSAVQRPIPGDRQESGPDVVVGHGAECRRVQLALPDAFRESDDIARLLAGQSRRSRPRLAERQEALRLQAAGGSGKALECGRSRPKRNLLLEDDRHECPEPGLAGPQGRRAVAGDDPGELGVPRGKHFRCLRQRRRVELPRRRRGGRCVGEHGHDRTVAAVAIS
jgi:hypothetical protein